MVQWSNGPNRKPSPKYEFPAGSMKFCPSTATENDSHYQTHPKFKWKNSKMYILVNFSKHNSISIPDQYIFMANCSRSADFFEYLCFFCNKRMIFLPTYQKPPPRNIKAPVRSLKFGPRYKTGRASY